MSKLSKTLEDLGLSEKEAGVYLACLELGPSPVQKIAQGAEINRVTAYVILENLVKQGLASTTQKGKKTLFTAEEPEQLSALLNKMKEDLERKKEALNEAMPELKGLLKIAGKKPIVRVYEGKEGLKALQKEYIKSMKTGSEVSAFVPVDELYKVFPPKEGVKPQRVKKRIKARVIYTSKKGAILESSPRELKEARYVPSDKFPFTSGFDIYGTDKVQLINFKDGLVGVMIESKELHDTFKIIFELAWEAAKKYQKK